MHFFKMHKCKIVKLKPFQFVSLTQKKCQIRNQNNESVKESTEKEAVKTFKSRKKMKHEGNTIALEIN